MKITPILLPIIGLCPSYIHLSGVFCNICITLVDTVAIQFVNLQKQSISVLLTSDSLSYCIQMLPI